MDQRVANFYVSCCYADSDHLPPEAPGRTEVLEVLGRLGNAGLVFVTEVSVEQSGRWMVRFRYPNQESLDLFIRCETAMPVVDMFHIIEIEMPYLDKVAGIYQRCHG